MIFIIKLFLILCIIFMAEYIIKRKIFSNIISNYNFWLIFSWLVCLLLYYFSGITYRIQLSLSCFIYIIIVISLFILGGYIGKSLSNFINFKTIKKTDKSFDNLFDKLFYINCITAIVYFVYVILTNDINFGITRKINANWFTTVMQFIMCSSLLLWIYDLRKIVKGEKKISSKILILAVIYNLPCILISGRDSIIIFLIATLIVICSSINKKINYKKMFLVLLACISVISIYMVFLSSNRYGSKNNSMIKTFENSVSASFPQYMIKISNNKLGKVLVNGMFYYTSQFSKLSLMYENYNGPYMYGLYQTNIIGRHIPSVFGTSYNDVVNQISIITKWANVSSMRVFWETAIGYCFYDFGKIGTLLISLLSGIIVSLVTIYIKNKNSILCYIYSVIACCAMFITVEMAPLFDYFILFPLIWIFIICFESSLE